MKIWGATGLAIALMLAAAGQGQDPRQYLSLPVAVGPAVIDYRQLFDRTEFGIRYGAELRDARLALQRENEWHSARFEGEEARIVELRKREDPTEYNAAAAAFHIEVTERRAIQDQKGARLEEWQRVQEILFREVASLPIVRLAEARGISTILPAENLIWYAPSVDLTRDVLLQINLEIGDGTSLDGYVSAVEYVEIEPVKQFAGPQTDRENGRLE